MNEQDTTDLASRETPFSAQVGAQVGRKLKAQRQATKSVWFGLGMSGLVGWSVTVPTLVGAAIGIWVDKHHPSTYSWTLMLLLAGLMVGCFNAWHWVASEYREMGEDPHE